MTLSADSRKDRRLSALLFPLVLFLLAGCSTPAPVVQYRQNPGTDFKDYDSFALMPLPDSIPGTKPGAGMEYGWTARQGIREALRDKGYGEKPLKLADFAVGLKGSIVPTIQVEEHGFNYGFHDDDRFWGRDYPEAPSGVAENLEQDARTHMALALEIFDVRSRELVWAGWVMVDRKKATPLSHEVLKYRIRQILKSIPEK